jgi:hypothetical protein
LAWQENARTHRPPWQLVLQQSAPAWQTSPSVLQVAPLGPGGTAAHRPPAQIEEQQSAAPAQLWPTARHSVSLQLPPKQRLVQHVVAELQLAPGPLQKVGLVHRPAVQVPEQQAVLFSWQLWPAPMHTEPGPPSVTGMPVSATPLSPTLPSPPSGGVSLLQVQPG